MGRWIRRSTLFTLIAVIGLLSLGIGYAAWTDSLTAEGTVNTGELNVVWANASTADASNTTGNCVFTRTAQNDHYIEFTLSNAYPGYSCTVSADIKNNGSIPAEYTGGAIVDDGNPELTISGPQCTGLSTAGDTINASASVPCSATITVNNDAGENQTYNAKGTVSFQSPSS